MDEIVALLEPTVKTFKFQRELVSDPRLPARAAVPLAVLSRALTTAALAEPWIAAAMTPAVTRPERIRTCMLSPLEVRLGDRDCAAF
jgi:hypothetical protein